MRTLRSPPIITSIIESSDPPFFTFSMQIFLEHVAYVTEVLSFVFINHSVSLFVSQACFTPSIKRTLAAHSLHSSIPPFQYFGTESTDFP